MHNAVKDHRFADLLAPIRDPTKNFTVDLAANLQEYLLELERISTVFKDGETVINFAEAALVIQGSTSVYGKKVEYLYNLIFQFLHNLDTQNNKKKGASKENEADHEESFEELSDIVIHPANNLNAKHKKNAVKLTPRVPACLIPLDETEKRTEILYSSKGKEIGNMYDFRIHSGIICSSGFLLLHSANEISVNNGVKHTPCPGIRCFEPTTELDGIEESGGDSKKTLHPEADDDGADPGADDVSMELDDPPPLKCASNKKQKTPIRAVRRSLRLQNAEADAQKANEPIQLLDAHQHANKKLPLKTGISERKASRTRKRRANVVDKDKNLTMIAELLCKTLGSLPNGRTLSSKLSALPELAILAKQQAKHKLELRGTKRKADSPLEEVAEEETSGGNDDPASDHETGDCSTSHLDVDNSRDEVGKKDFDALFGNISTEMSSKEPNNNKHVYTFEDQLNQHVQKQLEMVAQYAEVTDLRKRVTEWEERVRPILDEEEERGSFDIRIYGQKIVDSFAYEQQVCSFKQIVEDKEPKEVPRYFLASLLLANHYNVEIMESDLSPKVNTMQLKLLSRQLHHNKLDDMNLQ